MKLPTYPSMQACEAATGIPKATQQQAKRDGCDAFDQANRVSLEKLLRWFFKRDGEEGANWPDRLKRAQALMAELELDEQRGRLIDRGGAIKAVQSAAARCRAIFDTKMDVDLSARCSGKPADEIQELLTAAKDAAYAEIYGAIK